MVSSKPDWSLLPHQPIAFFGLTEGFEKRDLKRAYSRLIKVYKPEQHQEEFKRIRAAYESLEAQFRYRGHGTAAGMASFSTGTKHSIEQPAKPLSNSGPSLLRTFTDSGLEKTIQYIKAKNTRSPTEWIQLALLEDEHLDDPLTLYRSLFAGAQATGCDPTILNFMQLCMNEELDAANASQLLFSLTKLVASTPGEVGIAPYSYWFLTESLWLQTLTKADFKSYTDLLEQCSKAVGAEGSGGELVFMIRLLRRSMLRADPSWWREKWEDVLHAYNHLDYSLKEEVDGIEWISNYRDQRDAMRSAGSIGLLLDEAIVAIIEKDDTEGELIFRRVMLTCLDRSEELFAAFSFGERLQFGFDLLDWHANELGATQGLSSFEQNDREEFRVVGEFSRLLLRRIKRTFLGRIWTLCTVAFVFASLCAWIAPWAIAIYYSPLENTPVLFFPAATSALLAFGYYKGWSWLSCNTLEKVIVTRLHRSTCRELISKFLRESHIPLRKVAAYFRAFEESENYVEYQGTRLTLISQVLDEDQALLHYSNALQFTD